MLKAMGLYDLTQTNAADHLKVRGCDGCAGVGCVGVGRMCCAYLSQPPHLCSND
jgi:hypothetical protein